MKNIKSLGLAFQDESVYKGRNVPEMTRKIDQFSFSLTEGKICAFVNRHLNFLELLTQRMPVYPYHFPYC